MRVRQVPLALDELAVLGVAIAGLAELARHVEAPHPLRVHRPEGDRRRRLALARGERIAVACSLKRRKADRPVAGAIRRRERCGGLCMLAYYTTCILQQFD